MRVRIEQTTNVLSNARFKLDIPDYFNFASDIIDKWAADPKKIAIWWVDEQGRELRRTFLDVSRRSRQICNVLTAHHIQTSSRSLHAQEIHFNDIRTTLQALSATYDNCNSLHTNAYDEAITTPTEESVRRALAIQLIINREWGLSKNENPYQGSFIIEELTDLVEEEVLREFERLSERGGVLGAMELGYQRNKIQDESLLYEQKKHLGELPIVGVNTFVGSETKAQNRCIELSRSTEEEKQSQLRRLRSFQQRNKSKAGDVLESLKTVAFEGDNIFAELMKTVKVCSLGQITRAMYEVGGQYRRNV